MDAASSAFAGAFGAALPFALVISLAFFLFRGKIEALIERVKSLTIAGQKAELSEPQQQKVEQAEPQILLEPVAGRAELPPPTSPLYEAVEEDIRRRLAATAPNNTDVQLAWAIRIAANAMIDRDMEVTYRIIFGSQIAVLKEANMRGGSISVSRAQEIYEQAKELHPSLYDGVSFDAWCEFPITRNLVTRPELPVTPNSRAQLTEAGKQFLFFITAKGLFEAKYG